MNQRKIGSKWERIAAEYLTEHGMHILESNFRCRQGEIDIIGWDGGYLVFVEVKYRRTGTKGSAIEAVNQTKMKKICRVADYYRYSHFLKEDTPIRYDVIAVDCSEIRWIKNAYFHKY